MLKELKAMHDFVMRVQAAMEVVQAAELSGRDAAEVKEMCVAQAKHCEEVLEELEVHINHEMSERN